MQAVHGIDKLTALQNLTDSLMIGKPTSNYSSDLADSGFASVSHSTPNSDCHCLVVDNVACARGDRQLFSDLSFQLNAGECLHIIGANGSGKTSLLRILCGISRPESGTVQWNNRNTVANPDYLSTSAYIAHKDGLKNELTAIENLRCYQQLSGVRDEEALDDSLNRLGILECADLFVQQLSFGQKRRLAFARLLLSPFKLWILDEPFTGIDVNGRAALERLCVDHLQHNGSIIITHHQSLENSALNAYCSTLSLSKLGSQAR